jgi:hypothetical protein
MQKIIFFTAGPTATSGEIADIAKLNSAAAAPYEVAVMNGAAAGDDYGDGRLVPHDFVAGSIPDAYSESTEVDPDAIPASLPEGSTVPLIDGGDTEAEAVINEDGKAELSGDFALVEDGTAIAGTGGTFTPTVVAGEITGGVWVSA